MDSVEVARKCRQAESHSEPGVAAPVSRVNIAKTAFDVGLGSEVLSGA